MAGMITIRLNELLEKRGESILWLSKKIRARYATLWQMARGEVVLVNLQTLDKICTALECQVGDLLMQTHKRKVSK
jgi:putative transcriptional regulator